MCPTTAPSTGLRSRRHGRCRSSSLPVRRFTCRKGQRHLSGLWWSATTGGHVGFESWMERDHVMALDFDPTVVGIASQPFWLSWRDDAGKLISHAPDFFARRADGTSVVVDCRLVERRKRRDAARTRGTSSAASADIDALYELVERVDQKVDALDVKVDRRFDEISGQLSEVLRQLGGR